MADSAARQRLSEERKSLLKNKPHGMFAKPTKSARDGAVDLMRWEVGVLPKAGSVYELPDQGTYRAFLLFSDSYPVRPPRVAFDPPVFHPNLFLDGRCCLSLLLEEGHHGGRDGPSHWTPTVSVRDILMALQQFFEEPNPDSVAHTEAAALCKKGKAGFEEKVRAECLLYPARLAEAQKKEAAAAAAAAAAAGGGGAGGR